MPNSKYPNSQFLTYQPFTKSTFHLHWLNCRFIMPFQLQSSFQPAGDQPQAIEHLTQGILEGEKHQVLLGVTGSGKTYTVANVIQNVQRPTLVLTHNKTLV